MVAGRNEIVDVFRSRVHVGGVSLVIGVGGADVCLLAPRQCKEHALVGGVGANDRMVDGQMFFVDDDVHAFGGAQKFLRARNTHGDRAVSPRAGGVNDARGFYGFEFAAKGVFHNHAF